MDTNESGINPLVLVSHNSILPYLGFFGLKEHILNLL